MTELERVDVFGVNVSIVDYAAATEVIASAAEEHRSLGATALAVHGLVEAVDDPVLRRKVNALDVVTPDGQPVRWAMNLLHGVGLRERVYGPDLMAAVCATAAERGIGVYLFGSTVETCQRLERRLHQRWPELRLVGVQADRFREATADEDRGDVERIHRSGAGVVFVGRGCPRQEHWVADHLGQLNAAMLGVGAAFDYHAGNLRRPPPWMQRVGLEWLWRLSLEPGRLWRRYAITNTRYLLLLIRALGRRIVSTRLTRRGGSAGADGRV